MTPLRSSPTPPDAPTPEEIAGLNAYVDGFYNPAKAPPSFNIRALASLLRAFEGMRADAERWRYVRQFMNADPWLKATGVLIYDYKIPKLPCAPTDDATVEQIIDAARASAPDRAPTL